MKLNYNKRVYLKNGQVLIRVKWLPVSKGKTVEVCFSVGVPAEESKWNKTTERAKTNTVHTVGKRVVTAKTINTHIEKFIEFIDCSMKKFADSSHMPTKDNLKREVNSLAGRDLCAAEKKTRSIEYENSIKAHKTLDEIFNIYLKERSVENNWGNKTHFKYEECVNHLASSCGKKPCNIYVQEIDKAFMNKMKVWYIENNYSNYTIQKHFRNAKAILRWAKANGFPVCDEAVNYKLIIDVPRKTVTFLTREELDLFAAFEFPEDKMYLDRVRDGFCFCCYTGLRYSDLAALKWTNLKDDTYIEFYTVKTKDLLRIPLIPPAKQLINKYRDIDPIKVFPVCSNQKMNAYLKEAAKLVGLDREILETRFEGTKRIEKVNKLYNTISCHDARRTMICISLAYNIPPTVVQKISGHADLMAMKPYINTDISVVSKELDKWTTSPIRSKIDSLIDTVKDEKQLRMICEILQKYLGDSV